MSANSCFHSIVEGYSSTKGKSEIDKLSTAAVFS
ncbi:hypothetical protein T01_428 [Trichinella spiralis]|uniref:Uncharacterized protein n=1 Tax=Trichinella spiralis TaxID=6334 RepID=A0A0V0YPY7_TRISP|nr:hypothetical protein T01_428 [Trichinella spiralis]